MALDCGREGRHVRDRITIAVMEVLMAAMDSGGKTSWLTALVIAILKTHNFLLQSSVAKEPDGKARCLVTVSVQQSN